MCLRKFGVRIEIRGRLFLSDLMEWLWMRMLLL